MRQASRHPPAIPQTARELAKWHIRRYVARGDSLASLRRGGMSYGGGFGEVRIHLDHILVYRVGPYDPDNDNDDAIARFPLAELYHEIQAESRERVTQGSLFDGEATP